MANPTKYTADILQEIFTKVESGEKTISQLAQWHGVSKGSINNYFLARKKYNSGLEVNAQNVSMPVFTAWACKYGGAGEPKFKKESGERKHTKKKPEQIEMEIEKPAVHIVKDEIHELANDIPVSELSAKDKKELAMYAIDQHYFFLKQLTGVI